MANSEETASQGLMSKQIIKKDVVQKKLMDEILVVTAMIQKEFPELYEHLSETPLFLSNNIEGISLVDFKQYLESLKTQLATFKNAHLRKYGMTFASRAPLASVPKYMEDYNELCYFILVLISL